MVENEHGINISYVESVWKWIYNSVLLVFYREALVV